LLYCTLKQAGGRIGGRPSVGRRAKRPQFPSRRTAVLTANGGYNDGYSRCACFWGSSPGYLVRRLIASVPCKGLRVSLDLGCREGKNAYAIARAGPVVTAVDCSELAIANGRKAFTCPAPESRTHPSPIMPRQHHAFLSAEALRHSAYHITKFLNDWVSISTPLNSNRERLCMNGSKLCVIIISNNSSN
jgi:hypothetical protein